MDPKKANAICRSTEEMCHAIEEVNQRDNIKDLTIFSMDISGFYPALDINECAKMAADMWHDSDMELNLNKEELGLYLAVTVSRDKLVELGIADFCHVWKSGQGAHPGITTSEILHRDEKTKSLFHKPVREPSNEEARFMFKIAFEILIKAAMKNHLYSFNGDLRRQNKDGAIGNILTGALGVLYTVFWCKAFLDKVEIATSELTEFVIYLLRIYIDDQNVACEALPTGARLVNERVVIVDSEVEADKLIPSDQRTAKIMLEIANSVSSFIQLTSDCPSLHPNGFMPLLDLQVRSVENKIQFKFYKKEVSNPLVIMKNSAMPFKIKRAALSSEVLRRLRNTSRDLPWAEKSEILTQFSNALRCSGWDAKHRHDFIMAGLTGYHHQAAVQALGLEQRGEGPEEACHQGGLVQTIRRGHVCARHT